MELFTSRKQTIKKTNDTRELAEYISKMAKQLNQRFYRLEKSGVGTGELPYRTAQIETGKMRPRYTTNINELAKMKKGELRQLGYEINDKLTAKTSTRYGVRQANENRLRGLSKHFNEKFEEEELGLHLTKKDIKEFMDNGGDEILQSKLLDSEQIMEDLAYYKKQKVKIKDFIKTYNDYVSRTTKVNYSELAKEWGALIPNKE